jgi:phage terminase large subunit-like protein
VIEQEPGAAGKSVTDWLKRCLAGYPVYDHRPTGAKQVRAQPFAAQCEAGNVRLVSGNWNRAYLDELGLFPNGAYDDQVDASSGAFTRLVRYAGSYVPPSSMRRFQTEDICARHGVRLDRAVRPWWWRGRR